MEDSGAGDKLGSQTDPGSRLGLTVYWLGDLISPSLRFLPHRAQTAIKRTSHEVYEG